MLTYFLYFWFIAIKTCLGYNLQDIVGPWQCPDNLCYVSHSNEFIQLHKYYKEYSQRSDFSFWNPTCLQCNTINVDVNPCPNEGNLIYDTVEESCTYVNKYLLDHVNCDTSKIDISNTDTDKYIIGPLRHNTTVLNSICEYEQYSCLDRNGYISWQDGKWFCKTCENIINNCPLGTHPKRCATSSYDACDKCIYPPIKDNNTFRYGFGSIFENCEGKILSSGFTSPENFDNDFWKRCAWFLTPKYKTGYCPIECNSGFVIQNEIPSDFWIYPTCKKCKDVCPLGTIKPVLYFGVKNQAQRFQKSLSKISGLVKPLEDIFSSQFSKILPNPYLKVLLSFIGG